jgi:hypothetical protein
MLRFSVFLAAAAATVIAASTSVLAQNGASHSNMPATGNGQRADAAQTVPPIAYERIGRSKCTRFGAHRRIIWKTRSDGHEK